MLFIPMYFFFFFNDTATTEIYTLSLHDALPISALAVEPSMQMTGASFSDACTRASESWISFCNGYIQAAVDSLEDRKSTRLNSSHVRISYAVFCLKKKKKNKKRNNTNKHQR